MIIVSDNNLPLEKTSVICNAVVRITSVFNPFVPNAPFLYPLKTSKP